MAKKKVFVSFDYENDRHYKYLIQAWDSNPKFEFKFRDLSSKEINSWSVSRVKAALTNKINQATYTLVIVGEEANSIHSDFYEIGYDNWINFEIAKSKQNGNKLVGIKLKKAYKSPTELLNSKCSWAMSFTQESIIRALNNA